jgi:dTDP-4-dehydrorhamnose reductase
MSERLMITGAGGQLGARLKQLAPWATAYDRATLDVTDKAAVAEAVAAHDVVINAAAWTDVDGAEAAEQAATEVNGASAIAAACAGKRLIHVSTDYVFDGTASHPYPEESETSPINAYGRSKLAGERAVLAAGGTVVRTAWLYDTSGRNFMTTMLKLATERDVLTVVDDQHGQPTWALALARQLLVLASSDNSPNGIYHGTCGGKTTWYGFAREIFRLSGLDPARIQPTTSDKFPRPAKRPAYSVLAHGNWAAAGITTLPPWDTTLAQALAA